MIPLMRTPVHLAASAGHAGRAVGVERPFSPCSSGRSGAWLSTTVLALAVLGSAATATGCGDGATAAPIDAATGDGAPGTDATDGRDSAAASDTTGDVTDGSSQPDAASGYTLSSFAGGFDFALTLPPRFAPFLALAGDEVTREMPEFYGTASPNYFSYGFLWWLTGAPDLSTSALRDHLALYYTGLCALTTAATVTLQEPDLNGAPAAAADAGGPRAGALVARRMGTLRVGSCKGFDAPIADSSVEVSTYACGDHPAVLVLVSPQPSSPDNAVWRQLRAMRDTFTCW